MHLLAFFFFPIFGFGFLFYFLPVHSGLGAQQTRHDGDSGAEHFPRLDRDWMGYCADLGGEARRARRGALTESVSRLLFRSSGAGSLPLSTHGWRRGLYSRAASRLRPGGATHFGHLRKIRRDET